MARRYLFFTLLLAILLFYLNIGGLTVYILDEAKNATCAKEMYFRGDLVKPTFNGDLRGDKPPLHYFFMMTSYSVFGVTEFAARFFSAFMGVLVYIASILFVRRYVGSEIAVWTGLALVSTFLFMLEFHLSVPDPYLIAFILLANICFFIAYYEGRRWLLFPGYIFLSLAVLAKGPVAIVLTALGWLIFTWFSKQNLLSVLKFFQLHWGMLILLLVAAPWFIAVHLETDGAFTQSFFLDHNVNRFTETKEGHGGIPLLSVPIIFLVMLPTGLLLPRVLWNVLRYRENTILIFLLSMGIAPVIFFSFSMTVLPNYVMPGVPFLVMAISVWLYFHLKQISLRMEWVVFIVIALAIPIGSYIGISSDKELRGLEMQAMWLLLLPVSAIFGLLKYRQDRRMGLLIGAAGSILTFILICTVLLPNIDRRNPVIQSENIWRSPIEKRYYKRINPSYIFYLPDPVMPVSSLSDELPLPVLIFSRSDFSDSLRNSGYEEIFRYRNLFEKGETVIFSTPGIYDSEEVANLRTFTHPE